MLMNYFQGRPGKCLPCHWYFSDYQMGKSQNTSGDLGVQCPEGMTVAVPALRSVYNAISLNPPSLNFLEGYPALYLNV